MPVLAAVPVVQSVFTFVDSFKDTRSLAIRSIDGLNLLPFTGAEYIIEWEIQGLGKQDNEIILSRTPGMDGAKIDDVRVGPRDVVLPIYLGSDSSHLQFLDRKDGFRALLNHRGVDLRTTDGTFDLVAYSRDGDERSLRCLYASGLGGQWSPDNYGSHWVRVPLQFSAVRAHWYGERWQTPVIRTPSGHRWFGHFPPSLSQSRALGSEIAVVVPGDVESWADIDLVGPATSVTVVAPGLQVTIPAGLGSGETAKIVTSPRGRTALFEGEKDWARVGSPLKWAPLKPGVAAITITMAGASGSSQAVVSGDSLYEEPW